VLAGDLSTFVSRLARGLCSQGPLWRHPRQTRTLTVLAQPLIPGPLCRFDESRQAPKVPTHAKGVAAVACPTLLQQIVHIRYTCEQFLTAFCLHHAWVSLLPKPGQVKHVKTAITAGTDAIFRVRVQLP
jgi:hypothetical protein